MRTHLGCTGSVELGTLSKETRSQLEKVPATWLEFSPDPPSLVVRHVQPDAISAPREIAGELLEFLSDVSEPERRSILGGALYYLDEQTGQYFRLRVCRGGNLTLSWAHPDYTQGSWEPYESQPVAVVFEPYQCLNGFVKFKSGHGVREKIAAVIERPAGLCPQGEYELKRAGDDVELTLHDVNSSVLPLLVTLRQAAEPGSLAGDIEVTSFRPGDLDDYCRFAFLKSDGAWVVRPSLWSDAVKRDAELPELLEAVRG